MVFFKRKSSPGMCPPCGHTPQVCCCTEQGESGRARYLQLGHTSYTIEDLVLTTIRHYPVSHLYYQLKLLWDNEKKRDARSKGTYSYKLQNTELGRNPEVLPESLIALEEGRQQWGQNQLLNLSI